MHAKDRGRDLAWPRAKVRSRFDTHIPKAVEPKDPRLAAQMIGREEVPRRPRDRQRMRLDTTVRGFARLFYVFTLTMRLLWWSGPTKSAAGSPAA